MLTLIIGTVVITLCATYITISRNNLTYMTLVLLLIPFFLIYRCASVYIGDYLPTDKAFYREQILLENSEKSVYFDDWSQDENCITINDYYTSKNFCDWRLGFNHVTTPLVLQVNKPKDFNPELYQEDKPSLPRQVTECGN